MSGSGNGLSGRQPQAIRSALAVLQVIARHGPGTTAKQISAELDLPPATAYRIINLLVGEEYLVRLPDLSGFALGARFADLIGAALAPPQPPPPHPPSRQQTPSRQHTPSRQQKENAVTPHARIPRIAEVSL